MENLDFFKIEKDIFDITSDIVKKAELSPDDIFVLGCSTSEIVGSVIGENGNEQIGKLVIDTMTNLLSTKGIYLAVQGCEHINRALCIPYGAAVNHNFEPVSVIPKPNAGGAACAYYYKKLEKPVMIEHISATAGLDIGNTHIGMHIKFVQVPFKHHIRNIGHANVSGLITRPKLIGGERSVYH